MSVRAIVTAAFLAMMVTVSYAQENETGWAGSLAEALKKAKETGKPVFADFTSTKN